VGAREENWVRLVTEHIVLPMDSEMEGETLEEQVGMKI
jgi:hypothetical protein